MTGQDNDDDGRRDFDFLLGSWRVANRKLADVWDPGCTEWTDFTSTVVVRPLLANLANMDCYSTMEFPGRGPMEGITLRLFNPQTRLWRIWWTSTRQLGDLDTPVEGRFADGLGEFFCEENGRSLRVRYAWKCTDPERPRWTQAFSYDGGTTWKTNWIMELTRDADPGTNGNICLP